MKGDIECLSIIVPVYNEEASLNSFLDGLIDVLDGLSLQSEIIFVDDGSCDGSRKILEALCLRDERIRLAVLRRNFGKTLALSVGFSRAIGDVIFTMDADLQDDPREIPAFLEKLESGFDLVSGWKRVRRDPWHKTIPSRIFNFTVALVSGLKLHDVNCGFKAYRRWVVEGLDLYGELHRFIPVLAASKGARVAEIPVNHRPRRHGMSKYGVSRLPKGIFDLITVVMTTRYIRRPLHFFGGIGLLFGILGILIVLYLAILWILGYRPIGNRPLLFYGILSTVVGTQFFSFGILSFLDIFKEIEDQAKRK